MNHLKKTSKNRRRKVDYSVLADHPVVMGVRKRKGKEGKRRRRKIG